MDYEIIESSTGDMLGHVNISGMDDEQILQWLVNHGYLSGSSDDYEISRCFPFTEGQTVVIDLECNQPVLLIQLPEPESKAA